MNYPNTALAEKLEEGGKDLDSLKRQLAYRCGGIIIELEYECRIFNTMVKMRRFAYDDP